MKTILTLEILSDEYMSFIPSDLRYFNSNFDCRPITAPWTIPEYKIQNASKGTADFMCWMLHVPIVSEKCKSFIESHSDNVEFLPFAMIDDRQYYALNVLDCIDAIDVKISGQVPELGEISFKNIDTVPRIFRALGVDGRPVNRLFMSKVFVLESISLGLTGAEYVDPSSNLMKRYIQKHIH